MLDLLLWSGDSNKVLELKHELYEQNYTEYGDVSICKWMKQKKITQTEG